MAVLYRHGDPRYPFLWQDQTQPAARWHADGDGPVQYLADTPDGAWAEFLRHEEITDPADLPGIERRIWAVTVPAAEVAGAAVPQMDQATLRGGPESYPACQAEARRLRDAGSRALRAVTAARLTGMAGGWQPTGPHDGQVVVLFGSRPDLVGHATVDVGRPGEWLLDRVRPFVPVEP